LCGDGILTSGGGEIENLDRTAKEFLEYVKRL